MIDSEEDEEYYYLSEEKESKSHPGLKSVLKISTTSSSSIRLLAETNKKYYGLSIQQLTLLANRMRARQGDKRDADSENENQRSALNSLRSFMHGIGEYYFTIDKLTILL